MASGYPTGYPVIKKAVYPVKYASGSEQTGYPAESVSGIDAVLV